MADWSSRNKVINQLNYINPFLSKFSFTNPICRILSKVTRIFNYDIAFCRYQSRVSLYSLKADKKNYLKYKKKFSLINLGAGGFRHKRWINYDYPAVSNYYKRLLGVTNIDFKPIDLNGDLNLITEKEVQAFYLSHTLEHLPRNSGIRLLRFLYNKLIPGGVIRVAVPDHEQAYINNKFSIRKDNSKEIYINAIHMLSKLEKYPIEEILNSHKKSTSCEDFYNILIKKDPSLILTDKDNPQFHLSLWSRNFIKELSFKYSFDSFKIFLKNQSDFIPFTNSAVFDTTEPHHSLYFEIKKNEQ